MKKNIGVIYGGTNTEHEVSIVSARSIINALDKKKYNVLPIHISKKNRWHTSKNFLSSNTPFKTLTNAIPTTLQSSLKNHLINIVFPVIHGPFGEDGTLQGMLELMNVPYVGCGVLGSAICMDKDIQKRICQHANIPVVDYIALSKDNFKTSISNRTHKEIDDKLDYPCFVKPANQGSSIGVIKVKSSSELEPALKEAFKLDTKVLIEKAVSNPREIECSVLGTNSNPEASILGEIIPSNDFYDYDAKYIDGKSDAVIPAKLPKNLAEKIQEIAKKTFTVTECYGLARVDFMVDRAGEYYLNELNTMPGFTNISMYPKLWEASGIHYPDLLDKLINLAQGRHREKLKINYSYKPKSNWHTA